MAWPPNNVKRKNHTYEEDQPYLEAMWVNVISPALQRQGAEVGSIGPWSPTYQETGFQRDNSVSDMLYGDVSYIGVTGPARLTTVIAGPGAWGPPPDQLCAKYKAVESTCTATKRPDGSMAVTMETGGAKPSSGSYFSGERSVYHYRLDGSVVAMTSRAQLVEGTSYDTSQIPLTAQQLTELATNERIKLSD
jgi:hypothetical protein